MKRVLEKLRSILSTSAVGGFLGSVFGGALLGVGVLVSSGEVTAGMFALGLAFSGGVGAFIGGVFGTLLTLSKRRSLDELSLGRSAALGAVAGAIFPMAAAILTGGWLVPLVPIQVAFLSGQFGTLGAGLSAGLVAVAKDADDPLLGSRADHPLLPGEVHGQGRLPGRLVFVATSGLKQAHPGVVDEDVDTPEARHDLAYHPRYPPGVLHVELPARCRSPGSLDLLGDPGDSLGIAIHDGDPYPFVGEELHRGASDSARGSSDERDLARDPAVQLAETIHRAIRGSGGTRRSTDRRLSP